MTEEEKKAKSVGVRRNLSGEVLGEYTMRQDNARHRDISPMEAPEFTEDQKKSLDYYVNGESDGMYRFNENEMLSKVGKGLFSGRSKRNVPVRQRFRKPDGSYYDVTMGAADADDLIRKSVDKQKGKDGVGISPEELQNTAKKVDPRK